MMIIGKSLFSGLPVFFDFRETNHGAIFGASGSGKSVFLYQLLKSACINPSVQPLIIDGSGILSSLNPVWAMGGDSPETLIDETEKLVFEMEQRFSWLKKENRDNLTVFNSEMPLICVFLEEYPAILARLKAYDLENNLKGNNRLSSRFTALVGRLFCESRKAGMRIFVLSQSALKEAFESRQSCELLVSFRMEISELRAIFPAISPEILNRVLNSSPGEALIRSRSGFDFVKMNFVSLNEVRSIM